MFCSAEEFFVVFFYKSVYSRLLKFTDIQGLRSVATLIDRSLLSLLLLRKNLSYTFFMR